MSRKSYASLLILHVQNLKIVNFFYTEVQNSNDRNRCIKLVHFFPERYLDHYKRCYFNLTMDSSDMNHYSSIIPCETADVFTLFI